MLPEGYFMTNEASKKKTGEGKGNVFYCALLRAGPAEERGSLPTNKAGANCGLSQLSRILAI